MGNQNDGMSCDSKPSKFAKNTRKRSDDFIIKHLHKNRISNNNDTIQSILDQRRLVFVNTIGLYQSWRKIPSHLLYTALLILPLKKAWVYNPSAFMYELSLSFISQVSTLGAIREVQDFIDLLKWKDSQGLVMWSMDYFDDLCNPLPVDICTPTSESGDQSINTLIAQFWYDLSNKLCSLYDHITGDNYKPLIFDEKWWRNKNSFISKYGNKPSVILAEFYFMTMKVPSLCEIMYQSNPKSLHPVITYRKGNSVSKKRKNGVKFGFRLNNVCVASPLSPIKETTKQTVSVDSAYDYENENPYLKIRMSTNIA